MKFVISKRDFSGDPVVLDLDFEVMRYRSDVFGGPALATIKASGEREALFGLVNQLRAHVEIRTDKGEAVWWGYLAAVEINWGMIRYGIDVNQMSNKAAVAYTTENARFTTDWSQDDDSVTEYGYKEMLISRSDATEADAVQQRDTYLAGAKYPIPSLTFLGGKVGEAIIICRGWFSTFEWQYYENLSGFEGYTLTGQGGREVGEDDRPILAMSFQIGASAAWTAITLWLHIWRQGDNTPADNLTVSIRANNAGVPGSVLASSSVVGSVVPTRAEWVEFTLSAGVELQPSTTYFIYIARSGAVDEDAYYMIDTNLNNGYERGYPIYYNTNKSAWVNAAHKGDVLFKLVGSLETTDQIAAIVTACGQFYAGTIIEDASGVETIQYRNGDSTGLYEMEKLLLSGSSNARRMLAETTPSRYLRLYEEPVKPSDPKVSYGLDAQGRLYFQSGAPVDLALCPVGIWCHLVDVIPATVDLSTVADPSLFFIDRAEYNAQTGEYTILKTREQADPFEMGGIEQG